MLPLEEEAKAVDEEEGLKNDVEVEEEEATALDWRCSEKGR